MIKQFIIPDKEHAGHIHVHTHAMHGHAHGSAAHSEEAEELYMAKLIHFHVRSQVRLIL
jgi:zinc transporter 1/2/3